MWQQEQHRHKIITGASPALRAWNRTGDKNRTVPVVGCDCGINQRILQLIYKIALNQMPTYFIEVGETHVKYRYSRVWKHMGNIMEKYADQYQLPLFW